MSTSVEAWYPCTTFYCFSFFQFSFVGEADAFDALQALADLSLRLPEAPVDTGERYICF